MKIYNGKLIKVAVIFGTRPEAIKLAPVINALNKDRSFKTITLATAQHRNLLDQVLKVFKIMPDYDLNIMTKNQKLPDVTSKCLHGVDKILKKEKPDIVIIQGDTTTAFASALCCYYNKIPIGHVEAGLRTSDKFSPFPEEINRRILTVLSDLHFAPTECARRNLLREGVPFEKIFITGNTVVDALMKIVSKQISFKEKLFRVNTFMFDRKIILATIHRRESFGQPLEEICMAMREIADKNTDVIIICPMHPNPNVRKIIQRILRNNCRILLIEPLDYLKFVHLMMHSYIILTDSGGIQEEAPTLKKPVLIMREKTERPEVVETGVARLVGTRKEKIVEEVQKLLNSEDEYNKMATGINPFGDGKASERIVQIIKKSLN